MIITEIQISIQRSSSWATNYPPCHPLPSCPLLLHPPCPNFVTLLKLSLAFRDAILIYKKLQTKTTFDEFYMCGSLAEGLLADEELCNLVIPYCQTFLSEA